MFAPVEVKAHGYQRKVPIGWVSGQLLRLVKITLNSLISYQIFSVVFFLPLQFGTGWQELFCAALGSQEIVKEAKGLFYRSKKKGKAEQGKADLTETRKC